MSKYNIIKTATDAYIKANGRREITGPVLNAILNAIIESLGKYYQMVGVALPADDPGTPDQNVAFLAGTPGTYTKFGNAVVAAGEIALLKYDGEWSKAVLYSVPTEVSDLTNDLGFVTNSVNDLLNYYLKTETYTKGQVDALIAAVKQFRYIVTDTLPTASADTMNIIYLVPSDDPMTGDVKDEYITIEVGGVYSWEKIGRTDIDLSNYPTNAQMAQAIDDALAAYITGINATIDNNHGTPSVNVQYASGILTLAFHNLKGDTGERGPVGVESVNVAVDNNTGIPTATATMSGGVLTLNFYNLKGAQGNSGYQGAAGELLVVNNLTDGGATAALSAEMGKELDQKVSQLEAKVSGNLMSTRAKNALLAVFNKVAFAVPDVSAEMSELNKALFNLDEIVGITATFTQGDTVVYDQGVDILSDLRSMLVVKAQYGDGAELPVSDYVLSGELTTGTSTITVTYQGFTDTFTVVVTHYTAQMVFTMADGDVSKFQGSAAIRSDDNTKLGINGWGTQLNRRVFLANSGTTPIKQVNGTSTGKYPIPIPRNAKKITVNIIPSNLNNVGVAGGFLKQGDYSRHDESDQGGLIQGYYDSPYTYVLSAEQIDAYRKGGWFFVATAATKSGNYSSSNEPTGITITFE